jgi:hypothetical protein
MAQEYNELLPSGATNIFQDNIDSRKNDEALRSGFSGSAFPTSPVPVAGQRCYREDLKKEYIFNGENWVEVASSGAIAQEVALARGTHTKLQDRLGVSINPDGTLKTPATANVDEFKVSGFEPTYVSTNSFSVPGDMRAIFTEGRRLKITQGVDIIYPAVVSASYDDVTEKTTIAIDGITITNEIAAVDYSLAQYGLPLASETVKGVVELATPAEVLAGTDTERAVTPATLTAKILGTVSQLEGVPTGAIIERGSNANGEYVRFADGMMICWATGLSVSGLTVNVMTHVQYTFPATFIRPPSTSVGILMLTDAARAITTKNGGGSTTQCDFNIVSTSAAYLTLNEVIDYHAIGRWY